MAKFMDENDEKKNYRIKHHGERKSHGAKAEKILPRPGDQQPRNNQQAVCDCTNKIVHCHAYATKAEPDILFNKTNEYLGQALLLRREGFCGVSRSAERRVQGVHERRRDELTTQKNRASYRGCGSGEMIGPGPAAGRGLPAAGTLVPSPRLGSTGSS